MEKVYIDGVMEVTIEEIGNKMLLMDLGNMYGKMEEVMKDIGNKGKCMGKGFMYGRMEEDMKGNI